MEMAPSGNTTLSLAAALGNPLLPAEPNDLSQLVPDPTPWGPLAAVVLCLLPVIFLLLTAVIKPLVLPSNISLPLSVALLGLVRLAYLSSSPLLVLSHIAVGALEGLIPLSVIFGVVLLFETMTATGCLQFLMANIRCLSAGSPVAEVFLVGWAFAYTLSGVGGFSTPMALATPMLVSLGHDPLKSLVTVVGLNGLSAHLGSVGMAVWFGFKSLGLSREALLQVGVKSAAVIGACSFVVAPAAASFLVSWKDLGCNAVFVLLSIASAVLPTVLLAFVSTEFPLVAGGLISLFVTWLLVKYGIGLQPPCAHHAAADIETGGQNLAMDNRNMDMDVSAEPGDGSALNRQALPGGTGTDVAGRSTPQQNTHNTAQVETSCQPDRAESSSVKALACATDCSVAGCGSPTTSVFTKTAQAACKCCCVTTHHHQHCCHGPEPLMSPFELYCTRPPAEEHVMLEASQQCSASSSSSSAASPATDNVPVRAGCLDDCNRVQSLPSELLARAATASAATIQGALGGTATSAYLFTCQPSTPTKQSMVSCHNPEDAAGATNTLQLQLNAQNERSCAIITAEAVHDQPQHPRSTGGQATGDHPVVSGKDKVSMAVLPRVKPVQHAHQFSPDLETARTHARLHARTIGTDYAPPCINCAAHHHGVAITVACSGQPLSVDSMHLPDVFPPLAWHQTAVHAGHWVVAVLRTMSIWLTVLLLLLTHLPQLPMQDWLRSTTPSLTLHLGTLGRFSVSPSLVLQLQSVFTQDAVNWKAEALYIPCIIPFVVVSCVLLVTFHQDVAKSGTSWKVPFTSAWDKITGIVPAMLGALILAQLLSAGGRTSPAFIIAYYLTNWMGKGYLAIAGFLGALGSFVSGSVMGSNMTQGAIQAVAAARLGLPVTGLLAVQVAGACAGKMVCISSILAAKVAVDELQEVGEAKVLRRTAPLALLLVLLAEVLGLAWTLGHTWRDAV